MDEGYFSHLPILSATFNLTAGPVLELGSGLGSTLTLHGLCGSARRRLVTVESDENWLTKFITLGRSWHQLRHVQNFTEIDEYRQDWGLAFVDHGISLQRGVSIEKLKDTARVIVAHDSCHGFLYGYDVLNRFKYRWDYKGFGPHTTVVSDTVDIQKTLSEVCL